jgi:hypothetical protein
MKTCQQKGTCNMQSNNQTRRESRGVAQRFRAGKMQPVGAVQLLGGEGAMLQQSLFLELDPIPGRLLTEISAQMQIVFVPFQAIHKYRFGDLAGTSPGSDPHAGITEVIRQKIAAGSAIDLLEAEGAISKACGIVPRSISGSKKVTRTLRDAYNVAADFLRKTVYVDAVAPAANNVAVLPAVLGTTALQRLSGVLNPDDHINGSVQLQLEDAELPVKGIGLNSAMMGTAGTVSIKETGATAAASVTGWGDDTATTSAAGQFVIEQDASNTGFPDIRAIFSGAEAGGVSLTDFYNAEKQDKLTRAMRGMIEADPIGGEQKLIHWAFGMSMETSHYPVVVYDKTIQLTQTSRTATDSEGVEANTVYQYGTGAISCNVMVPRSELGGWLITIVQVRPEEVLLSQPHPTATELWGPVKKISEEFELDPVPVTVRDLYADCATADETTVSFYTGHNALKRYYANWGWSRAQDMTKVEDQLAMWQYQIPTSVSPESVIYPATLDHSIFADTTADVVKCNWSGQALISTPMFFGPTPVEEVSAINDEDLFGEEE